MRFSVIAIPMLNQIVRPFTSKWHRDSLSGAFEDESKCKKYRDELGSLQEDLPNYNRMLAETAEVENLTDLEQIEGV